MMLGMENKGFVQTKKLQYNVNIYKLHNAKI